MPNSIKNKFSYMGVVNATPDSFSDGGELQSIGSLKARLSSWRSLNASWIDLGGESTAPFNKPIGHLEEWQRVSKALESFNESDQISIDTFRKETILRSVEQNKISLWNDVSGKRDEDLVEVLKLHPDLQSVFCHNLAPTRADCHQHMKFLLNEERMLEELESYFAHALEWFDKQGFRQPMLDLCFGFSKSFEQNWFLLKEFPSFTQKFEQKYGAQQWILGISRKSFLKKLSLEKVDQDIRKQTEYMQASYLTWLATRLDIKGEVIVRLHDPALAYAVDILGDKL